MCSCLWGKPKIEAAAERQYQILLNYFRRQMDKGIALPVSTYTVKEIQEALEAKTGLTAELTEAVVENGRDKIKFKIVEAPKRNAVQKAVRSTKKLLSKWFPSLNDVAVHNQKVFSKLDRADDFVEHYGKKDFKSAQEFVDYFSPNRIGGFPNALHQTQLIQLGKIIFIKIHENFETFTKLNPTMDQVVELMSVARKFYTDKTFLHDEPGINQIAETVIEQIYDHFLSKAKSVEDWMKVANFKIYDASEWEWLLGRQIGWHLDRVIEIGDPSLSWIKEFTVERVISYDHPLTMLAEVFEALPEDERTESNNIRLVVQTLVGRYIQDVVTYRQERHPGKLMRQAFAGLLEPEALTKPFKHGVINPQADGKLYDADPDAVNEATEGYYWHFFQYLKGRERAGAKIEVHSSQMPILKKRALAVGYQIAETGETTSSGEMDFQIVKIEKAPEQTRAQAFKDKCYQYLVAPVKNIIKDIKDPSRRIKVMEVNIR